MNAVWNGFYALMLTVWLMVLAPVLPAQTQVIGRDTALARRIETEAAATAAALRQPVPVSVVVVTDSTTIKALQAQVAAQRAIIARQQAVIDSLTATPPVDTTTPPVPPDTTTPPPVPPDTARFSGPAELPRVYLSFPYPPITRTVAVSSGGLQAALNAAQRGDELVVSGTHTGNFTAGSCGNGWITVRSAGTLPPIGTRMTPTLAAPLAKLITPNTSAVITVPSGGCKVRLVGLEIAQDAATTAANYGLVRLDGADIVLDRVYVHGHATSNTIRCVALNSKSSEVRDSWLSECHASGNDAQAIWGGNGPGPYRIVNNYLEGSGENVMFGGSVPKAGLVPSDIEIRGNHLAKPLTWYAAGWTIKNLLELKNAARVLIEGNVLDGLQKDNGGAVIFKSANQAPPADANQCTWCRSTDVTFRRNHIKNVGSGIAVSGTGDNPKTDTTARRIDIRENVLDITQPNGNRRGAIQLGAVQQITWTRNVFSGTGDAAAILEAGGSQCAFVDNVWSRGQYGVFASGAGSGTPALNKGCGTAGYTWTTMTFVGTSNGTYPPGTTWISSESQSALAAQIRAKVDSATRNVVVPP